MPTGFCEPSDVRQALQETDLSGSTNESIVTSAITAVSQWFARATNGHWYDSTASSNDLVDSASVSASAVRLDVPSSPHRQDRQLFTSETGFRYPVTKNGPYALIPLPHPYVSSVTSLEVRGRGGGVEDWTTASDKEEGRGEDYYVARKGQQSYGRTYLYIRAASISPRVDYGGLITASYSYGLNWAENPWDDVRRGIANLCAAEVMDDDSVLSQIPQNARIAGVDTQHQNLVDTASRFLDPYLKMAVK
jgi:hypothetical protein